MVATDKKNKSSNEYSIDVGETDKKFTAYLEQKTLNRLLMIMMLRFQRQKISHFVNRNKAVQYWIALEPDSEF